MIGIVLFVIGLCVMAACVAAPYAEDMFGNDAAESKVDLEA